MAKIFAGFVVVLAPAVLDGHHVALIMSTFALNSSSCRRWTILLFTEYNDGVAAVRGNDGVCVVHITSSRYQFENLLCGSFKFSRVLLDLRLYCESRTRDLLNHGAI